MYSKRTMNPSGAVSDWRSMSTRTTLMGNEPMDFGGGSGLAAAAGSPQLMIKEITALKQDNAGLQAAVYDLQTTGEKLRSAIRNLKVENGRLKLKLKRVSEAAKASGDIADVDQLTEAVDFKDVKDFLLIGGSRDPLDIQYPASVKDVSGREFKTGERYLWFKMAEHFGDVEAAKQLLATDDAKKAQEIVDKVKNFDQSSWDAIKLTHFEDYQRLKFDQNRNLRCLLLKTAPIYVAIASQDKIYGTGWRKQRVEADRTQLWDGENLGGKILMKLRDEYSANHSWLSSTEEQEAKKAFEDNRKGVWKRAKSTPGSQQGGLGKRPRGSGMGASRMMRSAGNAPAPFDGYSGFFGGEGYTSFSNPSTAAGYGRNGAYAGTTGGFMKKRR